MSTMSWSLILLSCALLWGARHVYRRDTQYAGVPHIKSSGAAPRPAKVPATRRDAPPEVASVEWSAAPRGPSSAGERRALLRDRYIAARFPGVLRSACDLRATEHVIKAARHYFEEGRLEDAAEIFQLGIEETPGELSLRLAQIEIAYLARDPALFVRLARELAASGAETPEWGEVVRLGHELAPEEPLFAARDRRATERHFGPWPEMPNWIQASWDLTPEVLAADLHRAMDERAAQTTNHGAIRAA